MKLNICEHLRAVAFIKKYNNNFNALTNILFN